MVSNGIRNRRPWRRRNQVTSRSSGGLQADLLHLHRKPGPSRCIHTCLRTLPCIHTCLRSTGGVWAHFCTISCSAEPGEQGDCGRGRAGGFGLRLLLMRLHLCRTTLATSKHASVGVEEAPPPPATAERVVFVLASLLLNNLFEASLLSQTLELDQWIKLVQN